MVTLISGGRQWQTADCRQASDGTVTIAISKSFHFKQVAFLPQKKQRRGKLIKFKRKGTGGRRRTCRCLPGRLPQGFILLENIFKDKMQICNKFLDPDNYRGGRVLELGFGLGIAASEVTSPLRIVWRYYWWYRIILKTSLSSKNPTRIIMKAWTLGIAVSNHHKAFYTSPHPEISIPIPSTIVPLQCSVLPPSRYLRWIFFLNHFHYRSREWGWKSTGSWSATPGCSPPSSTGPPTSLLSSFPSKASLRRCLHNDDDINYHQRRTINHATLI